MGGSNYLKHAHWNYCYSNKYSISATWSYLLSAGCDIKICLASCEKMYQAFCMNFVLQAMNAQGLWMRFTYYHGSTPEASEIQMPLYSGHTAMVSMVSALERFHCYHERTWKSLFATKLKQLVCFNISIQNGRSCNMNDKISLEVIKCVCT